MFKSYGVDVYASTNISIQKDIYCYSIRKDVQAGKELKKQFKTMLSLCLSCKEKGKNPLKWGPQGHKKQQTFFHLMWLSICCCIGYIVHCLKYFLNSNIQDKAICLLSSQANFVFSTSLSFVLLLDCFITIFKLLLFSSLKVWA